MRNTVSFTVALAVYVTSTMASAGMMQDGHGHHSKYAGQENREIKSLSPDDIAELKRGGGWGLARAAELNGVPGPIHLLELKDEIPLKAAQISQIEELYKSMKSEAVLEGEKLIALEQKLESQFRKGNVAPVELRNALKKIAEARMNLRYIHLSAHLETPKVLSQAQIDRYNSLRGYSKSNPCDNVPSGHDEKMWRKHNGCR